MLERFHPLLEYPSVSSVSLVIVSHSLDVARGTAEMVRQMVGESVLLSFCGGKPGGGFGSDPQQIFDCIQSVWSDAGVVVMVDLGGTGMNAEIAVDKLPQGQRSRVRVCDAPIVEGSVMAATEASVGGTLHSVIKAAQEVRGG